MNTDDRQQHIDTLARCILTGDEYSGDVIDVGNFLRRDAAAIFDSTDPAVHDALVAALHANADRARVLAAHADAGWLDEEVLTLDDGIAGYSSGETSGPVFISRPNTRQRRLVTPWEPTP